MSCKHTGAAWSMEQMVIDAIGMPQHLKERQCVRVRMRAVHIWMTILWRNYRTGKIVGHRKGVKGIFSIVAAWGNGKYITTVKTGQWREILKLSSKTSCFLLQLHIFFCFIIRVWERVFNRNDVLSVTSYQWTNEKNEKKMLKIRVKKKIALGATILSWVLSKLLSNFRS